MVYLVLVEPEFFQLLWGHTCEVRSPVAIPVSPATKIEKRAALVIRANSKTGIRCPVGPSAKPVYSRLLGKCLDFPEIRALTMFTTLTTMTIVTTAGRVRNRIAYCQIFPGSVIVKTTLPICPDFVRVVGEIPGTRFRTIPFSCATPSPGRTTVFFRVIRGAFPG